MIENNSKKLFLLDAYALIFRAYYAFIKNPRVTSKGVNTSAIFGFLLALEEVLRNRKPTHIAVVFDTPTPTFRHEMFKEYKDVDLETFTGLVKSFVGYDENAWSEVEAKKTKGESDSFFAKRLITGLAAEQYFEAVQPQLPEFKGYTFQNTTRLGCGYDFRLRNETDENFLAVEVKGLKERRGGLSLTPKEHEVAGAMTDRFYLFVVKNFQESPFHEIYQNPLSGALRFAKKEPFFAAAAC